MSMVRLVSGIAMPLRDARSDPCGRAELDRIRQLRNACVRGKRSRDLQHGGGKQESLA
jgi:hypothetical protein